jgi:Zn finger protein HypA/HybF involved in hydrogenase expression
MTTWYEFVCLDCGYGGLTKEPEQYRQGQLPCPRCGSLHFEVQEQGLAPLPDEEELPPEVED